MLNGIMASPPPDPPTAPLRPPPPGLFQPHIQNRAHQQSYSPFPPNYHPPPRNFLPTHPAPVTLPDVENVLYPDLLWFESKNRKYYSESEMTNLLSSVLSKYGVTHFNTTKSDKNTDPNSSDIFHQLCLTLTYNNCSFTERSKPVSDIGCCGILIQSTLVRSKFDHPHMLIKKKSFQ